MQAAGSLHNLVIAQGDLATWGDMHVHERISCVDCNSWDCVDFRNSHCLAGLVDSIAPRIGDEPANQQRITVSDSFNRLQKSNAASFPVTRKNYFLHGEREIILFVSMNCQAILGTSKRRREVVSGGKTAHTAADRERAAYLPCIDCPRLVTRRPVVLAQCNDRSYRNEGLDFPRKDGATWQQDR